MEQEAIQAVKKALEDERLFGVQDRLSNVKVIQTDHKLLKDLIDEESDARGIKIAAKARALREIPLKDQI